MKKFLTITMTVISLLFVSQVSAAPAYSQPIPHVQPDGSVIELYLYGDENYHFYGDKDGYLLKLNNGRYEYVVSGESAQLMFAEADERPSNAVKGYDLKPDDVAKKTSSVPLKIDKADSRMALSSVESNDAPVRKETKMLVIAVEFDGEGIANKFDPVMHSPEKIYEKFFGEGEGVSSVDSYYDEVSGGRQIFVPAFELPDNYAAPEYGKVADGVIKVKLDYEHPDTMNNGEVIDAQVGRIVEDAVEIVDNIIDFSVYNTNGADENGMACITNDELILSFIVAGYEASGGSDDNSVWAHSSALPFFKSGTDEFFINDTCEWTYIYDGEEYTENVNIIFADEDYIVEDGMAYMDDSYYAMMGAMYSDDKPMGIGSFCHELGHVLGLPDLYNTIGGSNYDEVSTFSLMCAGSWGRNAAKDPASSPTHLDPWSKIFLGWYDEDELIEINYNKKINIDILTALAEKSGCRFVKVNTKDPDEYYLVENRGVDGYDEGLKYYREGGKGYEVLTNGGIAVWHIDDSVIYGETEYVDNLGNPLTRLDKNLINTTATPGIRLIRHSKDLSNVLDNGKPLWSFAENDLSMFGKKSEPASMLNTYSENGYSGVEMQFMSEPADEMRVYFGHGIAVTVSRDNEHTVVYAVNDSDETVTVIPFVDKFLGGKHETYKLPFIELAPGENGISSTDTLTDGEEYAIFFVESTASDTTVHVHNGTSKDIHITPIIVDEDMNDVFSFHSDIAHSGGCISESNHDCILENNKKYKMFSFDVNTMKPLSKTLEFTIE